MSISEDLWKLLACPVCQQDLILEDPYLSCGKCGQLGQIRDGVLDFQSFNDPVPQPEIYDDARYQAGVKKFEQLHELHYESGSMSGRLEDAFKSELMKLVKNPIRPFIDVAAVRVQVSRLSATPSERSE